MIYYTYCPETFIPQGFVISENPPPNSTTWAPPAQREGQQVYFNGHGWMHGRPLDQITPKLLSEAAQGALKRELRNAINALTSGKSPDEVATYSRQEADAREYLKTGTPSLFLETLSRIRGVDVDVLAQKIVIKANAYHEAVAVALGTYQRKSDELEKNPPVLTQALLQEPRMLIP
jgi:hypothetical protein